MSKTRTDKVRTFKENKRIKVKTTEGVKYIGRLHIVDNNTIKVEGFNIELHRITNIKSRSIGAGIAGTGLIIFGSFLTLSGGLLHMWPNQQQTGNGLLTAGAIIVSSGIFFNEFARNQRSNKWTYKIIEE
ncbi:hypothetical protein GCM10007103_26890 [Salinimicrobium marinum]|uniref:Uncharacterized protein n=2 Tax=Salinimicrobium marinum TaxID=680283 RepID=A0A918W090_9FLAO|nr:hypothetical protein GCM10007103_26890 [Salinimicrobium marinum]